MTRYNEIADQYKQTKSLDFFRVISHSMQHFTGDVTGHAVLDLACGEGFSTRLLKDMGATRTVGVDISEEMVKLAQATETQQPQGIEYVVSSAQELGKLGTFDTVSATFLLNYAQSRDDLYKMFKTAHDNLRPGSRFVTISDTLDFPAQPPDNPFAAYGYGYGSFEEPLKDGSAREISMQKGDVSFSFTSYHYSQDTYVAAAKEAGFKKVEVHKPLLPPDMQADERAELWAPYLEQTTQFILVCEA